jgi:hypothetical protein
MATASPRAGDSRSLSARHSFQGRDPAGRTSAHVRAIRPSTAARLRKGLLSCRLVRSRDPGYLVFRVEFVAVIVLAAGLLLIVLFRPVADRHRSEPGMDDPAAPAAEVPAESAPAPSAPTSERRPRRRGILDVRPGRSSQPRAPAPATDQVVAPSALAARIAAHIRLQHPASPAAPSEEKSEPAESPPPRVARRRAAAKPRAKRSPGSRT